MITISNMPDELLLVEIRNLLPDNQHVVRFTGAIQEIIDGLKYTEHFCPYACPTITALELVIRTEVDDADYAWSIIRDLDTMRNDINDLRHTRNMGLYRKYGLEDNALASEHPVYNAANTQYMRAEREAGRVVVADDMCVKILPGCNLETRESAAEAFEKLLKREAELFD